VDFGIYAGDTNKTIYLRLRDSTTGLAKTGLVFNSAGAVCSYTLPLAARAAITLATQTVTGAHSDGGFVEVDATNCKGLYRLDLTDAAIASGDYTIISIEFDGIIEESIEIPLHTRKVDVTEVGGSTTNVAALATNADAIKTKTDFLPSATAGAAGGVFIAGTNAATTVTTSFTTTFTGNLTGSVGSVTGAVGSVTGAVGSVTGAVGSVAGNVDGNVTGSVGSLVGHTVQTGDSFARLGAPAGASVSADVAAVKAETALIVADTNELQTDWADGGRLDLIIDSILVDTGTTLDDHLTDIKGTGFVKDTHSLIDIETYVDLIDDGTSGLAKIATDVAAVLVDTADMQPKLGTPAGADMSADIAAVKAETALIVADTNELQTDWADGGRLDLLLDAIPTTAMRGTDSAALASVATEARLAELDAANLPADIDAILVDTTEIGVAGVGLSNISLPAAGLDLVLVDGETLPAALQVIAAACIGIISGAGTGTETVKGLDKTTTRAVATVDASGNRSAITYTF